MQADDVRPGIQLVQRQILRNGFAAVAGVEVVREDVHPQRLCNAALGLPDAAKADDAHGLALQLDEGVVPVAPVHIVGPIARVDALVVVADVVADLQQHGNGELAHRSRAVGGHIDNSHPLFPSGGAIHHVIAGGQHCNELHGRALVQRSAGDGGLVQHHHLGVADALGNEGGFGVGRAVIKGHIAQCFQPGPAQVTGVFGVSVQYYDLHRYALLFQRIFLPMFKTRMVRAVAAVIFSSAWAMASASVVTLSTALTSASTPQP